MIPPYPSRGIAEFVRPRTDPGAALAQDRLYEPWLVPPLDQLVAISRTTGRTVEVEIAALREQLVSERYRQKSANC